MVKRKFSADYSVPVDSSQKIVLHSLLKELEKDLQDHESSIFDGRSDWRDRVDPKVLAECEARWARDNGGAPGPGENAREILAYAYIGDSINLLNQNASELPEEFAKYFKRMTPYLTLLIPVRNRLCHPRQPTRDSDSTLTRQTIEMLLEPNSARYWPRLKKWNEIVKKRPSAAMGVEYTSDSSQEDVSNNLPSPDYDGTSFIGREEISKKLTRLLTKGANPWVTITGEGAVGKTSLALQVATDLSFCGSSCPFDLIIWVTAKTTQLSGHEIKEITDSVKTFSGLLGQAAEELSEDEGDPFDQLLEYMDELKILLVLDNLETVRDPKIEEFMAEIPLGSKVLATSRVGLRIGTSVPLGPMESREAIHLFRKYCEISGCSDLQNASHDRLDGYCNLLNYNPGVIKWFISSVRAGSSPDEVFNNKEEILLFCMNDVFESLDTDSRILLDCIMSISEAHSIPVLSEISGLEHENTQIALATLKETNFLYEKIEHKGRTPVSKYGVNELAKDYLKTFQPTNETKFREYLEKHRDITQTLRATQVRHTQSKYSWSNIKPETEEEMLVATKLLKAFRSLPQLTSYDNLPSDLREQKVRSVGVLLDEAEKLAPGYFEVHKAQAIFYQQIGQSGRARDYFITAKNLAPDSAPVRFFYGQYLETKLTDYKQAAEEYISAHNLDVESSEVLLRLVSVLINLREYDRAQKYVDILAGLELSVNKQQRAKEDVILKFYIAKFKNCYFDEEVPGMINAGEVILEICSRFNDNPQLVDSKIREKMEEAFTLFQKAKSIIINREIGAAEDLSRLGELADGLGDISEGLKYMSSSLVDPRTNKYSEGDRVQGKITGFDGGGPVVEVDGLTGKLPRGRMCYGLENDRLDELHELGETIDCVIYRILPSNDEYAFLLSRLELLPSPWDNITDRFSVGDIVEVLVGKKSYGDDMVWVELEKGVTGCIWIEEFHDDCSIHQVAEGQRITAKILKLLPGERRVHLSPRRALHDPWFCDGEERFKKGQVIQGVVAGSMNETGYYPIEIEKGLTGDLYSGLSRVNLKSGDSIEATIIKANCAAGWMRLSQVEGVFEVGQEVEGEIIEKIRDIAFRVNLGGYEGFLPLSEIRSDQTPNSLIGSTAKFEVINIKKKIGVSIKSNISRSKTTDLINKLEPGLVRKVRVKKIEAFGAFVTFQNIVGLLRVKDMIWGRLNHPTDFLEVGDEITVKILSVDLEKERVNVGLKQLEPDPWGHVESKYPVNSIIKCKVVNLVAYGAFVELEPGVDGLLHVSELSWLNNDIQPSEVFEKGQEVEAMVLDVRKDARKISLGTRQLEDNPWGAILDKYTLGSTVKSKVCELTDYGVFVKLEEGIEGFIHGGDLSWTRHFVRRSKALGDGEYFKVGDEIEAQVLEIDPEGKRISLGIKQLSEDPWEQIHSVYNVGDLVTGKIIRLAHFGFFVGLKDEIEGLVHISQVSEEHVDDIEKSFEIGQEVCVRVIKIDRSSRRISLSVKAAEYDEDQLKREAEHLDQLKPGEDLASLEQAFDAVLSASAEDGPKTS